MAVEKRLLSVEPTLATSDGTQLGKITVENSSIFKVKQQVLLRSSAPAGPKPQLLEVKRVLPPDVLFLGPIGGSIDLRADLSIFRTEDGVYISADEQRRPTIPEQEISRATYEEEPAAAVRTISVDAHGTPHSDKNPTAIANPDLHTMAQLLEIQVLGIDTSKIVRGADGFALTDEDGNILLMN